MIDNDYEIKYNIPSFFHIGFHKTGTTFLQKSVFACHPEISLRDTAHFFLDEGQYQLGLEHYFGLFRKHYERKVVVESSEGLSGSMFEPGPYELLAARINEVNSRATVLLFLRNQIAMVESLYKQYLKEGGILDFTSFLGSEVGAGALLKLTYLDQVSFYKRFFGKNLKVFLYEEMVRDSAGFLKRLYDVLGVSYYTPTMERHNRGRTVFTGDLYRVLNQSTNRYAFLRRKRKSIRHVLDFMDNRLVKYLDERRYMSSPAKNMLLHRYRETNRLLSEAIGIDLAYYGYPQ